MNKNYFFLFLTIHIVKNNIKILKNDNDNVLKYSLFFFLFFFILFLTIPILKHCH